MALNPLRRARALRNLSQERLALLSGVNADTISKAERGLNVSALSQARLARALNVPIEELFPEAEDVAL